MFVIRARNVNDAYAKGIALIRDFAQPQESRAGNVLAINEPVTTVFNSPTERILWDGLRDCNPFFHLFESFWILGGRNEVDYLTQFNKKMADFSDDGTVFHGAYGFRLRHWFGFDQLNEAIETLIRDPKSRRVVVSMWSPNGDMIMADGGAGGASSKDLPCNLMIKFEARNGILDMIVFNRSNDMIWGAYGANAVHFSFIQEYVAARVGVPVGRYWQISSNYHVYDSIWKEKAPEGFTPDHDIYINDVEPVPSFLSPNAIDHELMLFLEEAQPAAGWMNPVFSDVGIPMLATWRAWKSKDRARALVLSEGILADDWRMACQAWMKRRIMKEDA